MKEGFPQDPPAQNWRDHIAPEIFLTDNEIERLAWRALTVTCVSLSFIAFERHGVIDFFK